MSRLTKREQGILEMHEAGYSTRDISISYSITRGMVEHVVEKAKRKLVSDTDAALSRVNDLLSKVLIHANCDCENEEECPCLIAAYYLKATNERNKK